MKSFLIEVPHEDKTEECARAVKLFLQSGSHYLTHADWGCMDGEHKCWIVIEANDKEEARRMIPSVMRSSAKIVMLNKFSMENVNEMMSHHQS
jgi:nicotinate-nucleotide pyrophosphorylase